MKTNIKCLLCGDNDLQDFYISDEVSISICNKDGLVFLNPRKSKEDYVTYYSTQYAESSNAIKVEPYSPSTNRMWSLISKTEPDTKKAILDVGAGSGSILERLKQEIDTEQIQLTAIEPHLVRQRELNQRNIKVISSSADEIEWSLTNSNHFDLVIMRHVLEHFMDPIRTLQNIHCGMSEGGHLCIEVPNCQKPLGKASQYFILPHTFYFSVPTLSALLTRCGFEIVHIETCNNDHVIQVNCTKKSNRIEVSEVSQSWAETQVDIVSKVSGVTKD